MGFVRQQNVWKCDHCGKEEPWGPNWRSRLILHKSGGPGPWDEELVACSQDCQDAIDNKRRRRKLPDKKMTPEDLIADLRSRINPAYANQIGTESWERRICADALEEQTSRIDLLYGWEADARARAGLLELHLRAVLEVARTWQPEYATEMDLDTLQYAQECADGKVPNDEAKRRP